MDNWLFMIGMYLVDFNLAIAYSASLALRVVTTT